MSPSAETASLGRIQAVLFDMDGLLVDSERIYSDVVNEVLAPYGKKQTWDIKARLMGKPERVATSRDREQAQELCVRLRTDTDGIKSGANPRLFAPFGDRAICGDDVLVGRGKPHPDIFLLAARRALGGTAGADALLEQIRAPGAEHDGRLLGGEQHILVFEDGIWYGCPTRMYAGDTDVQLVAVSEQGAPVGAHQTLSSLEDFRPEQWGLPPYASEA